jgi:hypothetical protein
VYEWIVVIRPLIDAERLVQHLGDRRQAVGRARRVRDDVVLGRLVDVEVDAAAQRDVRVLGGRADEHLLGRRQVLAGRGLVDEATGRLDDDVDPVLGPRDGGRVLLGTDRDGVATDDEVAVLDRHLARVLAVHRVVLQQVGERADVGQIVDEHEVEGVGRRRQTAHEPAADAAEPVDTDANLGHGEPPGRMRAR